VHPSRGKTEASERTASNVWSPTASHGLIVVTTEQRRFQLVGCGMPKSGTTTVAAAFAGRYRSQHECGYRMSISRERRLMRGSVSLERAVAFLQARDRTCKAEVDSTSFLWEWRFALVEALPDARFVLTFREPLSWASSMAKQLVRGSTSSDDDSRARLALVALRIHAGSDGPSDGDDVGLSFAALVADYWTRCATEQLLFPPERSTWIDMHQMASGLDRLTDALGLAPGEVENDARANVAPEGEQVPAMLTEHLLDGFGEQHHDLLGRLREQASTT